MQDDIDKKLKQTLGTPRGLNQEQFTARVMNRLRQEKQKEARASFIQRFLLAIRPTSPRLLLRASLAAALLLAVIAVLLVKFPPNRFDEVTVATLTSRYDFGPPVPRSPAPDTLLMKTDSKTILLTEEVHLISNDPLLRPHSIWEQKTL